MAQASKSVYIQTSRFEIARLLYSLKQTIKDSFKEVMLSLCNYPFPLSDSSAERASTAKLKVKDKNKECTFLEQKIFPLKLFATVAERRKCLTY